jgi:hypothetical protein
MSRTLVLEDSIPTVIAKPGVHDLIRDAFWARDRHSGGKRKCCTKGNGLKHNGHNYWHRCTYATLRLLRLAQDDLWSNFSVARVTSEETNNATNIEARVEICISGFDIYAQN